MLCSVYLLPLFFFTCQCFKKRIAFNLWLYDGAMVLFYLWLYDLLPKMILKEILILSNNSI